jgi:hypothetical protein
MPTWELISAGVDWLTASARHDGKAALLYDTGKGIIEEERRNGYRLRRAGFSGYRGYSTGRAWYGWRTDGSCVRLSSEAAKLFAARVIPAADKLTRLDLQVTARANEIVADLAEREYRGGGIRVGVGRQSIERSLYLASTGGSTLYLGAPTSDQRGRLYDKSAESRGALPANSWRAEVQYRAERADHIGRIVDEQGYSNDGIVSTVDHWFAERGTQLYWAGGGVPWSSRLYRDDVTDDKKLIWLQATIRPMLEELFLRRERSEILYALGLFQPEEDPRPDFAYSPSFEKSQEDYMAGRTRFEPN